jgi:glycosyltransferase involved in cell wall biosynthesis
VNTSSLPAATTTTLRALRNTVAPRVSVVVPAMNEARNLEVVLPELVAAMRRDGVVLHEVVLVDGGSVDDTVAVARRVLPEVVVVHQVRRGKGNALAAGFARVTGDVVVMFDADVSADPGEIVRFVRVLQDGADVAKGSRFTTGGGSADITPVRAAGNWGLNLVFNVLFGGRYSDLCYGYNAFWADMVALLDLPDHRVMAPEPGQMLWGDGFEIETVIACRFAAAQARVVEVASVERLRAFGASNLHAVRDGLRVLRTLLVETRRARTGRRTSAVPAVRTIAGSAAVALPVAAAEQQAA